MRCRENFKGKYILAHKLGRHVCTDSTIAWKCFLSYPNMIQGSCIEGRSQALRCTVDTFVGFWEKLVCGLTSLLYDSSCSLNSFPNFSSDTINCGIFECMTCTAFDAPVVQSYLGSIKKSILSPRISAGLVDSMIIKVAVPGTNVLRLGRLSFVHCRSPFA